MKPLATIPVDQPIERLSNVAVRLHTNAANTAPESIESVANFLCMHGPGRLDPGKTRR